MAGGMSFAVRDNAVNTHGSNLDQSTTAMNERAKAFITAIEPLQGVWQGTAYGSWQALTEAWNGAMANLNSALGDIKGRVGNAGALYDQYHTEQAEALSAVQAKSDFNINPKA